MAEEKQIFNTEELTANQKRKENLYDLVESGECILMAGAGCSANIHRGWAKLMEIFTQEAQVKDSSFTPFNAEVDDYLSFADRAKKCLGNDTYYHIIYSEYKVKPPPYHEKHHEVLCALPFKGIMTTNYDRVLEYALAATPNGLRADNSIWIAEDIEQAKIFEFLSSLNDPRTPRRIFHIHGISDHKKSIVLCGAEYREKYGFSHRPIESTLYQDIKNGNLTEPQFEELLQEHGLKWTAHRKILWSLLATRRVLFLGFSMDDPYFLKMLDAVSDDLHVYNMDNHYIVLRVTPDTKEKYITKANFLRKKYGVETVFYEDDISYKGFERFIFEMQDSVKLRHPKPMINRDYNTIEDRIVDKGLTARLLEISKQENDNED